eukprot:9472663-Pyramimonas_sp.AAC.1
MCFDTPPILCVTPKQPTDAEQLQPTQDEQRNMQTSGPNNHKAAEPDARDSKRKSSDNPDHKTTHAASAGGPKGEHRR